MKECVDGWVGRIITVLNWSAHLDFQVAGVAQLAADLPVLDGGVLQLNQAACTGLNKHLHSTAAGVAPGGQAGRSQPSKEHGEAAPPAAGSARRARPLALLAAAVPHAAAARTGVGDVRRARSLLLPHAAQVHDHSVALQGRRQGGGRGGERCIRRRGWGRLRFAPRASLPQAPPPQGAPPGPPPRRHVSGAHVALHRGQGGGGGRVPRVAAQRAKGQLDQGRGQVPGSHLQARARCTGGAPVRMRLDRGRGRAGQGCCGPDTRSQQWPLLLGSVRKTVPSLVIHSSRRCSSTGAVPQMCAMPSPPCSPVRRRTLPAAWARWWSGK